VVEALLAERYKRHRQLGILELRHYNARGVLTQAWTTPPGILPPGSLRLPAFYLDWVKDPAHRNRLLLSKTYICDDAGCRGRRVMRFISPVYQPGQPPGFAGAVELIIDPYFIAQQVTTEVRSGKTGYPWIIDQDRITLAHYEKEFVGVEAMAGRRAKGPQIIFWGLEEMILRQLEGEEGVTEYSSGWHRQKLGQMPKLAAYTPIRFDKGLIRELTDLEDPKHNLWGVCVTAPVEEVAGQVREVLDKEMFLVLMFALVILVATGSLVGVALVFNKTLARQVELKTAELLASQERLMHSERFAAVGEAAAYVSHEIKNPLMVIGGMAGQVERKLGDNPAAQEKLRIIQGEVRRLEYFLGELRDFLRPASPHKVDTDLNQVVHEVQVMMVDAVQEKGVRLEERLERRLPAIQADPNQLKQVLLNLVKNALEATEASGAITLATGLMDGQVWFSVQDNGKGMSGEVLDKIFHPFFTTKDKGTGLGLAVIHKIITDHHGAITVDSVAGGGTTFTIRLPLQG
jgi:signal transduction histidine kinase